MRYNIIIKAHKKLHKNQRHDVLKYVIMSLMSLCEKQSGNFTKPFRTLGVTSHDLTFQGHVTSSVTWPFDSP